MELNPRRKSEIVGALAPWVRSPDDIKGRDDLTGLLARHPEVERRHIKLWLTSGEVVDALLNSAVANRSEYAAEHAKRQLRLWVPNESFNRARDVIDENQVCIISGAPGIGKTMLADVLFAGYVSLGYQPIAISEDIEEGVRAWQSERRQIFLYDDFLGHVTYGELHLRKNEPSDLARFMQRVRDSQNKRFILTTREYILSEAVGRYEHLPDSAIAGFKNVISLEDYTEPVRARILYNHLFFTDLSHSLKSALLPDKKYWDVIRHPNYSPRVIEHAVGLAHASDVVPEEFASNLISTLENPSGVWGKIFDNLSLMGRRVLQAVATLPTETFLGDVMGVVRHIWPNDFDPGEFSNALRMLEGTFINIDEATPGSGNQERLVTIRDPSVRDYLWGRFKAVAGEADMLLDGAIFFEQCVILYEGALHSGSVSNRLNQEQKSDAGIQRVVSFEKAVSRATELFESRSPVVSRNWDRGEFYCEREPMNLERRTEFLASISVQHRDNLSAAEAVISALETLANRWGSGLGDPADALRMLRQAERTVGTLDKDALKRAERCLLGLIASRTKVMQDFEVLAGLVILVPGQSRNCMDRGDGVWSGRPGC
ncbi:MAG: hypothetical protein OXF79_01775 [Chloroflexi bacterium]|nr:hypothetical protein [Chloroflexota bacterium]